MSFWEYSNTIYQSEQVRNACLTLQNNHSLDVNMLLFCCWHGNYFGEFSQDIFTQCHEFSNIWSKNAVHPLRRVRTWLKQSGCSNLHVEDAACMAFREQVKQIELEAEKMQQMSLENLCDSKPNHSQPSDDKADAIGGNLKRYLDMENIQTNDSVTHNLEILAINTIEDLNTILFRKALAKTIE